MSSPISLFIIVFTLGNILACLWLMWWTARYRASATPKQVGEPDKTGHVWDEDLEEYNNPLPRWWLGLFIITVVFGIVYLLLYPGLGNFGGLKGWTQVGAYEKQVSAQRVKLEERLASLKDKSILELARDTSAMSTAKNLFGQNCSPCHGSDARGAKGFPNLVDNDWLWGGTDDAVYTTIAYGRQGTMPPWGEILGPQGVEEVAAYVYSLTHDGVPAATVAAGRARFTAMCAACHGADAKGNPLIGAPDLTDNVWLYGGDLDSIRETIAKGRSNQMPAHLDTLGDTRVRLLAAYVLSLGDRALQGTEAPASVTARLRDATAGEAPSETKPAT
jgi:cytochrome c oxidase cbb3-type subunit 3